MTRRARIAPRVVLGALALGVVTAWVDPSAADAENSCESCHRNPDFLVTHKKLYDYYQQWQVSIHRQEEVTCDECHGGDPRAVEKDAAHEGGVGESDPASGIHFTNVADTCGTCHDEILDGFRSSAHFEHVEKSEAEDGQGPTCVTCHGAIDSEVLNVNTVAKACAQCHNEETGNEPETPEKARHALNRFLSIQRFYRYIAVRAEAQEAQAFFESIDPKIATLATIWHTFDLARIEAATGEVLAALKAKRDELRRRDGERRNDPEGK